MSWVSKAWPPLRTSTISTRTLIKSQSVETMTTASCSSLLRRALWCRCMIIQIWASISSSCSGKWPILLMINWTTNSSTTSSQTMSTPNYSKQSKLSAPRRARLRYSKIVTCYWWDHRLATCTHLLLRRIPASLTSAYPIILKIAPGGSLTSMTCLQPYNPKLAPKPSSNFTLLLQHYPKTWVWPK